MEENATEEAQVIPNNIAEKFLDNWISILMSLPQSLVQFLGGRSDCTYMAYNCLAGGGFAEYCFRSDCKKKCIIVFNK